MTSIVVIEWLLLSHTRITQHERLSSVYIHSQTLCVCVFNRMTSIVVIEWLLLSHTRGTPNERQSSAYSHSKTVCVYVRNRMTLFSLEWLLFTQKSHKTNYYTRKMNCDNSFFYFWDKCITYDAHTHTHTHTHMWSHMWQKSSRLMNSQHFLVYIISTSHMWHIIYTHSHAHTRSAL